MSLPSPLAVWDSAGISTLIGVLTTSIIALVGLYRQGRDRKVARDVAESAIAQREEVKKTVVAAAQIVAEKAASVEDAVALAVEVTDSKASEAVAKVANIAAKAVEVADTKASEVKEALVRAVKLADEKLNAVREQGNAIHGLMNGAHLISLQATLAALQTVAELRGNPEDIIAVIVAGKAVADHQGKTNKSKDS